MSDSGSSPSPLWCCGPRAGNPQLAVAYLQSRRISRFSQVAVLFDETGLKVGEGIGFRCSLNPMVRAGRLAAPTQAHTMMDIHCRSWT